jgi:hypothetical protein
MYATTCQECGRRIWVAMQQDGWRMGGRALLDQVTWLLCYTYAYYYFSEERGYAGKCRERR